MSKNTEVATVDAASAPTKKGGVAIVSQAESYPFLTTSPAEVAATIAENFGGEPLSLGLITKIKFPTGGNTRFSIPNPLGGDEPEELAEIRGVIMFHLNTRTYWEGVYGEGEAKAPDCHSDDGVVGIGMYGVDNAGPDSANPSGLCKDCPVGAFTKDATGKSVPPACKSRKPLFIVPEGSLTPILLTLPPTSLTAFTTYIKALSERNIRVTEVVTTIRLKKELNTKMAFARTTFKAEAILPANEAAMSKAYARQLKDWLAPRDDEPQSSNLLEAPAQSNESSAEPVAQTVDAF